MIKVFVGDPFLCMQALKPFIYDLDVNSCKESTEFSDSEIMFLCGLPIFGINTLIYRTDVIDTNEILLSFLNDNIDCNLFIITEKIVKGRKLFNKFTELNAIENHNLDFCTFSEILKNNCSNIPDTSISYIADRCGLRIKDNTVYGSDVFNWAIRLSNVSFDKESIDKIVPEYKSDNVWQLKDHLLNGNKDKCIEIADTILKNNGAPIMILSAILGDIRILLKLSYFKDDKKLLNEAIKAMGTTRKVYCRQSISQLSECYDRLLLGIERLKSGYHIETEFKTTLLDCLIIINKHQTGGSYGDNKTTGRN